MKRRSLFVVMLLLASVSGLTQDAKSDVKYDTIIIPQMQFSELNFDTIDVENMHVDLLAAWNSWELTNDSLQHTIPSSRSSSSVSVFRFDHGTVSNGDYYFEQGLDRLSFIDDITAITVTKSLLDMMPEIRSYVEDNGVNIQKVVAKLQQIDVASSANDDAKHIMRDINRHLNREAIVLMRVKNETDDIIFYGTQGSKGDNNISSLIMFSDNKKSKESSVLIRLMGVFNTDDIKQIIMIKGKKTKQN
jgi:hypothetical protein